MVKKKHKIVWFAKIWEHPRQHFGIFEDWRNFGNPQKNWQVFETGGRTYFALLVDRFITYTNKIGSSVTRAI